MKTENFFAVDLGATSGRTILGTIENSTLRIREISRFPNHIIQLCGHCYWDIFSLYHEILDGLKKVADMNIEIHSIGIDTWGVDVVFIDSNGEIAGNPYSYRDPSTVDAPQKLFSVISKEDIYAKTGIQTMNFNTLFQLYTRQNNHCCSFAEADKILFMPDALSYLLTGKMVTEYTISSTSQMLDVKQRRFDQQLLSILNLDEERFAPIVEPGTVVGTLRKEIQTLTGLGEIPVIAVAGHDTASAVAAVPAVEEKFAYLSSGTWSLMGIESENPILTKESYSKNFTNEGGVNGTIRFLKNICGMWLLERCRLEWEHGEPHTYEELITLALQVTPFRSLINPDAPDFANPQSMIVAIQHYCQTTGQPVPVSCGEITRCIFESLALRYRQVFHWLESLSETKIPVLYIIGGGSRNALLNQFTSNSIGVKVMAGPSEATAIGNIMLQAKSAHVVDDMNSMRSIIANSVDTVVYQPQDTQTWAVAFEKYLKVCGNIEE